VTGRPSGVTFHYPDGSQEKMPHCPYAAPPPPNPHGLPGRALNVTAPGVCKLGYAHAAPMEAFFQHSMDIASFEASYIVPEDPTIRSAAAGNILYYWIGLQDTGSSANPVIQPVLSWRGGTWYFGSSSRSFLPSNSLPVF
jgi:hypothetical protein